MDLSLNIIERYGWTWHDFVFLRPKRFYDLHNRQPDQHLPPIQFLAVTLILFFAISITSIKLVTSFFSTADSPIQQSIEVRLDPNMLIKAYMILIISLSLLELHIGKKYAEVVGQRATTECIFIAKCYSSSLLLILPAVQTIINLYYVLLYSIGIELKVQFLGIIGMLCGTSFFIIFTGYNLAAMAAFNKIPFRTYVKGYLRLMSAGIVFLFIIFLALR